jgi:hypothetical protein
MQGIVFMIDEFVLFRFFNGYIPVRTGFGNVCIKSMNRRRNYRSFNFKFKISDQIKKYCTVLSCLPTRFHELFKLQSLAT